MTHKDQDKSSQRSPCSGLKNSASLWCGNSLDTPLRIVQEAALLNQILAWLPTLEVVTLQVSILSIACSEYRVRQQ